MKKVVKSIKTASLAVITACKDRFVVYGSSKVSDTIGYCHVHKERELSAITPEDLDRYLAEFICSVRRKDGGELNSDKPTLFHKLWILFQLFRFLPSCFLSVIVV